MNQINDHLPIRVKLMNDVFEEAERAMGVE